MSKIFVLGYCLIFLVTTATAEPLNPALTDTWQFTVAAFNQHNESKFRVTSGDDAPIAIDMDDLGLQSSKWIPQVGIRWHYKKKWSLSIAFSDFQLASHKSIDKSFNFDGVTYPINASLKSDLDLSVYITSLDYALYQSDSTEWGVGFGLHGLDLSLKIDGSLNGISTGRASEDFLVPLPNIRFYTRHAFSPKLLGSFSAGWLSATIDQYDGALLVGAVALDYRFTERWSVGMNYQLIDIDLKVDRGASDPKSRYEITLDGFSLTLRYGIP